MKCILIFDREFQAGFICCCSKLEIKLIFSSTFTVHIVEKRQKLAEKCARAYNAYFCYLRGILSFKGPKTLREMDNFIAGNEWKNQRGIEFNFSVLFFSWSSRKMDKKLVYNFLDELCLFR